MSSGGSVVENPVTRWVFLTGSRTGLALALAVGIVALTAALTASGVLYVGAGSNLSTALASGLLSGLLTLVTVVLSINQLILSRVFGNPSSLSDTVDGSIEFRRTVEDIAGVRRSPNDPAAFLALVGRTLTEHADRLRTTIDESAAEAADARQFTGDLAEYGEHLASAGEVDDAFEVIVIALGTSYAEYLAEIRQFESVSGELWSADAEALEDVLTLLKAVATMRQFFKTLAIQQDLARLSRQLIYSGFVALLVTYYLSQVYTADSSLSTALPESTMPVVTSVAAGVVLLPFLVLVVYLLRVATVTLYTVSVGAFVPPVQSIEEA